jgi:hypothetical protein
MRRALAILKYVPAVLCGLLVVAWVVSIVGSLNYVVNERGLSAVRGSLAFRGFKQKQAGLGFQLGEGSRESSIGALRWGYTEFNDRRNFRVFFFPIPLILTCIAPPAAACLGYRFPLWSYFAWTALVAAELAFYLR